jgi:putative sigma-54 modulation protein
MCRAVGNGLYAKSEVKWMIIEYTGRQFIITEKYRVQAEAGLERISKVVDGAASAHVILSVDKYRKIAEVTVKNGHPDMVANCESAEMATALRDALAKVEQQAIRYRQRTTTIMRHPKVAGAKAMADVAESDFSTDAAESIAANP